MVLLTWFFLMIYGGEAVAQYTLVLDKPGRVKRLHYNSGDFIFVKLNNGEKVEGRIGKLDSARFVINERIIQVADIDKVYKERPMFSILGPFIFLAALFTGVPTCLTTILLERVFPSLVAVSFTQLWVWYRRVL